MPGGRRFDVPAGGSWVRLEVPASQLGPSGQLIDGMAFSVNGGRAWFDLVGLNPAGGAVNAPMISTSSAATDFQRHSLYTPELQLMGADGVTPSSLGAGADGVTPSFWHGADGVTPSFWVRG